MKITRVIAVLAALLLSAGLIAACGSDEKADYAQQVEDILNPLGEQLQSLGADLSNASDEQALADGLGEAESNLESAASELESLDVPEGVEEVNSDLVAAINGFAGELASVKQAAEDGDAAKLQETALALPQVASDFETELADIQQAAIDAGVPIEDPSGE